VLSSPLAGVTLLASSPLLQPSSLANYFFRHVCFNLVMVRKRLNQ
jgi:hypothetical protein